MANSPVLELQALASDPAADIMAVLLKAKMIATKLSLDDLSEWIEYEIDGYPSTDLLPEYRVGSGMVKAWNPYHGWVPVGFGKLPADIVDDIQTYHLTESISSMQKQDMSDGTLRLHMPPSLINMIFKEGNRPPEACWFFSVNKLEHIVTTVRNKILSWSLELEKQGIMGEGLLFTQIEKEAAPMTVHNITNIHGNVNNAGVIGSGNGDIAQNNTVNAGDFNSLEKQLKDWGATDDDISSLHQAIQESPAPTTPDNFSDSLGKWVVNMIGKAYAGTINIAASAAPALLTNAICHYYNIPV